jgi:hypothetical protein
MIKCADRPARVCRTSLTSEEYTLDIKNSSVIFESSLYSLGELSLMSLAMS